MGRERERERIKEKKNGERGRPCRIWRTVSQLSEVMWVQDAVYNIPANFMNKSRLIIQI